MTKLLKGNASRANPVPNLWKEAGHRRSDSAHMAIGLGNVDDHNTMSPSAGLEASLLSNGSAA
eukprot:7629876-Lingulodinium_polyedra.AAC.1